MRVRATMLFRLLLTCLLLGPWAMSLLWASESLSLRLNEQTEISYERYAAKGRLLFIWQAHEVGVQGIDQQIAAQLAKQGIEVWLVNLLESYFLENTASNMDRVSAEAYDALLNQANRSGKTLVLGASGRGAVPVLRGVHRWQSEKHDQARFAGLVLVSPKLYVETPEPGTAARFLPIAEASNLPIYILQPNQSPWFWKLGDTMQALSKSGSTVFFKPLPMLRDRFYFRPDAVKKEQQAGKQLWHELHTGIQLLNQLPRTERKPAALVNDLAEPAARKERHLTAYQGNPIPPPLDLAGLDGKTISLRDLQGKVVLVNFWATWCPPCVHEMPSMQRLAQKLADKPFTLLGVNMAEDEAAVREFLQNKVKVSFPIVLDRDGRALKQWGVFAFPTSYVLDKQGRIRFALFGGVEWDDPTLIEPIMKLLTE